MPLPLVSGREDDALEYFFLGLTGHRDYMEDRANALLELPGCEKDSGHHASFFGVFDGHGGYQVADLVARGLPKLVGSQLIQDKDPASAIEEAFATADEELLSGSKSAFDMIGTTAIVTVAQRGEDGKVQKLYCANCGDSRAVLCRSGEALDISEDHKPTNPSEEERILKAGGWINRSRVQMSQGGEGGLLLSRALGDFGYKAKDKPVLISQPDIQVVDVGPEDEFVALGSDGVFDAYTSEELVAEIKEGLARGDALGDIVESIVEQALAAGDNTTLCVVRFKH
jgi:protein phosphatase 2C family protein 2/3